MLPIAALGLAFAVGCGGEKSDITAAVDDSNRTLKPTGASLNCPDEVDGGNGTKFNCTLKGAKTGDTAPLELKLADDTIEPVSEKQLTAGLKSVTGR